MTIVRQMQIDSLAVTLNATQGYLRTLAQPDLVDKHGNEVADWLVAQIADCLIRASRLTAQLLVSDAGDVQG